MPAEIDANALQFSIIIPIYNDWEPLEGCLQALAQQTGTPTFEVVLVDDGSQKPAPDSIRQFSREFPLTIVPQPHAGIPAARNRGVQNSKGPILISTDADCRLQSDCLAALTVVITDLPQHNCFQLHLVGDSSTVLGRAEDLRLLTTQDRLLQHDGRIRYLNTAGFVVRRAAINSETSLFDPAALRSEDTLLLANLIERGDLPFFATDAVVRHAVQMSFIRCILKDVRVAWQEATTFERIAAKGVQLRMNNSQRIAMLRSMWGVSRRPSIGRSAWFVLVARQALQRTISLLYKCLSRRSNTPTPRRAS